MLLQAALPGLQETETVRGWELSQAEAVLAAAEAAKAAAEAAQLPLAGVEALALQTRGRADEMIAFHTAASGLAQVPRDLDAADVVLFAQETAMWTAALAAREAELLQAVSECKVDGYEFAQENARLRGEQAAQDLASAAAVTAAWALKRSFPTGGEAGTVCAYPAPGADGSQGARPPCLDGLCCGAAQKFLKDGTKLSLETCQTCAQTHTYQYLPPLPAGAVQEPRAETWRWQEISAATSLAASAASALAAGYLMM